MSAAPAAPAVALRSTTLSAPLGLGERLFARRDALVFWDGAVGLGAAARIETAGPDRWRDLRRRAQHLYASIDGPAPPLFGGLAFAPGFGDGAWSGFGDASFVLPRWLVRDGTLTFTGPGPVPLDEARALLETDATLTPPRVDAIARVREPYTALVATIRDAIASGLAEKIVATRRTEVSGAFDDAAVLAGLPRSGLRFAFRRAGVTFLGATPERLLQKSGTAVTSEAVAGTSATAVFGAKDHAEHAPVVRHILAALTAAGARPQLADAAPRVLPDLAHLVTPVTARSTAHLLELAAALHPTPAVGGTPVDRAVAFIRAHEPPRGWYTGAVGWFDARGDGELRVALRCGLVSRTHAVLFAGAGIVAASQPDAEYEETLLKERPMLRALGTA